MRTAFILLLGLLGACTSKQEESTEKNTPVIIQADSISDFRSTVKKEPVATHQQKVPDELNNWKFAVNVYETERRFHFTVRMQYKELRISDSLNIPNLGIEPSVQIQKDETPFSCTIGFLDKKGTFKPFYKASVVKEQLRFKKIASYGVGVYRKKADGE